MKPSIPRLFSRLTSAFRARPTEHNPTRTPTVNLTGFKDAVYRSHPPQPSPATNMPSDQHPLHINSPMLAVPVTSRLTSYVTMDVSALPVPCNVTASICSHPLFSNTIPVTDDATPDSALSEAEAGIMCKIKSKAELESMPKIMTEIEASFEPLHKEMHTAVVKQLKNKTIQSNYSQSYLNHFGSRAAKALDTAITQKFDEYEKAEGALGRARLAKFVTGKNSNNVRIKTLVLRSIAQKLHHDVTLDSSLDNLTEGWILSTLQHAILNKVNIKILAVQSNLTALHYKTLLSHENPDHLVHFTQKIEREKKKLDQTFDDEISAVNAKSHLPLTDGDGFFINSSAVDRAVSFAMQILDDLFKYGDEERSVDAPSSESQPLERVENRKPTLNFVSSPKIEQSGHTPRMLNLRNKNAGPTNSDESEA